MFEPYVLTPQMYTPFIKESWKIEGYFPDENELKVLTKHHVWFIKQEKLTIPILKKFVKRVDKPDTIIRDKPYLNVSIGGFVAPQGGETLIKSLKELLEKINHLEQTPFESHCAYEFLHPFTDCNGRSGRAIWLWMMSRLFDQWTMHVVISRGFTHQFYYQTLTHMHSQMRKETKNA